MLPLDHCDTAHILVLRVIKVQQFNTTVNYLVSWFVGYGVTAATAAAAKEIMNIHIESVWWRAGSVDRVVGECRMTRSQLQVRAVKHCGLAAVSGATLRHLSHAHTRQRQDISRDFQKPYFVAD